MVKAGSKADQTPCGKLGFSMTMHAMRRLGVVAAVSSLLALLLGAGCVRVRPYERELLSVRAMTSGAEGPEDRFRQHWQGSREGGMGGFGGAGGGCGCN